MIFGMSIYVFTLLHTAISLIGIVTGLYVLYGMLNNNRLDTWTAVFLASTVLTSVTGFGFPFTRLLPSHIVGIISLAPTQSEPPFAIAETILLIIFLALGYLAIKRFRPAM